MYLNLKDLTVSVRCSGLMQLYSVSSHWLLNTAVVKAFGKFMSGLRSCAQIGVPVVGHAAPQAAGMAVGSVGSAQGSAVRIVYAAD